jgi:hypothetical protein
VKKSNTIFLLILIILISSVGITSASAEILSLNLLHSLITNMASIYGKTYTLQVDHNTFNIYYGFNVTYANATNILLVPEKNSVQISLKDVTQTDAMWIEIPQSLIAAEKNNFILHVDGQEEKYELATSGHSTILGFMVHTNATLVEIQGTHIVPEFPLSSISVMIIGFVTMMILGTKIIRK